jgi:chloride channel protein, CIC family
MTEDENRKKAYDPLAFSLLAVLVGVIGGLGAVIFRALISFFHNLLFFGEISFVYEANIHTPPSPWGPFVILVPVVGAVGVSFLITRFAPEAQGHGVPEVMDSIYYGRGIIRPIVAVVKSVASALSIGSGGSVGREGPIIQIGSCFGSTLGQLLPMPAWHRVTLIASGTGAGIAATFNTPIGGMLFAMEIMLHEVSVRTLMPVAISTATATYIGQIFFGVYPAFHIQEIQNLDLHITNPLVLLSYIGLGLTAGMASALYIQSIYAFEDFFEKRMGGGYYARHMLGMLGVGALMYLLLMTLGHYYIEGVGYAAIQDVLTGKLRQWYPLMLLFVLKLLATSLTLGSGASGGIFSPALFIGAMLGGAYGTALGELVPSLGVSTPAFAIAGMAGVVGGSTGAAMAAIVMIFEMTLDYNVILPITITVALSNGIRWLLSKDTIYTLKLTRRGHTMPGALQTNFQYLRRARTLMEKNVGNLPASLALREFAQSVLLQTASEYFLVEDHSRVIGVVSKAAAIQSLDPSSSSKTLGEVAAREYVTVGEDSTLLEVVSLMHSHRASFAFVSSAPRPNSVNDVKGLITTKTIADALAEGLDLFSQ